MNQKVDISKTAEKKLDKLFDYLIEEWSVDVKNEFVGKLNDCIIITKTTTCPIVCRLVL